MNFHYDKASDSLYIELSASPSFDSEEVSEGVVVDYNKDGQIVGLDIEYASRHVNMQQNCVEGFSPAVDVSNNL